MMKSWSICLACCGCFLSDGALGIPFQYYTFRAPPTSSPTNLPTYQPSQQPSFRPSLSAKPSVSSKPTISAQPTTTPTQKMSSSYLRTENSFMKSKWMIITVVGAILSFAVLGTLIVMKSKSLPCSVDRDDESQYSDDEEDEDYYNDEEGDEEDYDSFDLNLDLQENRSRSEDSSYKERRRRRRRDRRDSKYGSSVASASLASESLASVSEYSVSSESSYGLESRTSSYSSAY